MALEAKKNCAKVKQTAATVLSFWKIVSLLILSTTLWSEEKGIYI